MIKNDYKNNNKIDIEENYDRIHLDIEKNLKILKKKDIQNFRGDKIFIKEYVEYPRKECPNFYNEMYKFLKNSKIPDRIKSYYQIHYEDKYLHREEKTNGLLANPFIPVELKNIEQNKKQKRKAFRKLSKKYDIINDRFIYKYKVNKKINKKKIPYKIELDEIFYSSHIGAFHNGLKKSKKILLQSELYMRI